MITATEIKANSVIRLDGELFKVVASQTHSGGGKAGSMVHVKLRSVESGSQTEKRLQPDAKIEDVDVTRKKMQYLFRDADTFTFMDLETFDQVPIQKTVLGPGRKFLKEEDELEVEFLEDKPLSVNFPKSVNLRVRSTSDPIKGDKTAKPATLENGHETLVAQFVKEGDLVRIEVETGEYLDRVNEQEEKGLKFETGERPPEPPKGEKPKADKPKPDKD